MEGPGDFSAELLRAQEGASASSGKVFPFEIAGPSSPPSAEATAAATRWALWDTDRRFAGLGCVEADDYVVTQDDQFYRVRWLDVVLSIDVLSIDADAW